MNGITVKDSEITIVPVLDQQGKILSGMVVDNIDYERVDRIIITNKGELKLHPVSGFEIFKYLKSQVREKKVMFKGELIKELKADGFVKPNIIMTDDLLNFSVEV